MAITATEHDSGRALSLLEAAMEQLFHVDVEALAVVDCEAELARLNVLRLRIEARQSEVIRAVRRQHQARARQALIRSGPPLSEDELDARSDEVSRRTVQDELVGDMQWTPSKARTAIRDAERLRRWPLLKVAFDGGAITARHVTLAADLLDNFESDTASGLVDGVVDAARKNNTVEFAKYCRKLLAQRREDVALRDEQQRHAQRCVRIATGDDGMLHLSGRFSGIDAEVVSAAIRAFRQPDPSSVPRRERRTPEQVTADAFTSLCNVALKSEAPARKHGVQPHISVTIDYQTLLAGTGAVDVDQLGSLPFAEVRRLLADAHVSRILVDPRGLPLEAGPQVRTVPAGLYRALRIRDGQCVAVGCSMPAEWCQVAHLETPYRFDGRLQPNNAALMCHRHHRNYDLGSWELAWRDGKPTLRPPRSTHESDRPAPPTLPVTRGFVAAQAKRGPPE